MIFICQYLRRYYLHQQKYSCAKVQMCLTTEISFHLGQAKLIFCLAWHARMSTLCSAWNIFFPLFSAWNYFIYFRNYALFIFLNLFFIVCLLRVFSVICKVVISSVFFYYYESRATMCESILKILSIFAFSFDITYEILLRRGFVWNGKKTLI